MKKSNLNPALMAAILIAISSTSHAKALTDSDVQTVKEKVQQMSQNVFTPSSEDIQNAQAFKSDVSFTSILQQIHGDIKLTCGAGSHGGNGDPV